jgi:5-methylcytosine-specific restriction endonuclease McrBC regulatory subunit McrC
MRIILWRLWLRKFAAADQYGLPRRVVKRVHQGLQIKGHLNVRKSLFPLFTKRQVVSEYREKEIDDTICRIVYKAYSILVNNKMNYIPEQIQDSLNSLYSYYQGQLISVSEHDYHDINYKSIYLSWKPLVDFSWQIIKQEIFNQQEKEGKSYSIFLDMAEIWEAYLRKKLGEGLKEKGWRVLSVEECTYKIYKDKFYERDIIPDIILERENGGKKQYMVFDAKYKRMRGIRTSAKYSDVDRSDLFQIHTYIHYVQTHMGKVVLGGLLYPITQKGKNEDGTEYEINDDVINSYHSERLFGGSAKEGDTQFIIDGIFWPEKEEDEKPNNTESETEKKEMKEFKKRTDAMIGRIRDLIPKP